jgi:hypothetical protein
MFFPRIIRAAAPRLGQLINYFVYFCGSVPHVTGGHGRRIDRVWDAGVVRVDFARRRDLRLTPPRRPWLVTGIGLVIT